MASKEEPERPDSQSVEPFFWGDDTSSSVEFLTGTPGKAEKVESKDLDDLKDLDAHAAELQHRIERLGSDTKTQTVITEPKPTKLSGSSTASQVKPGRTIKKPVSRIRKDVKGDASSKPGSVDVIATKSVAARQVLNYHKQFLKPAFANPSSSRPDNEYRTVPLFSGIVLDNTLNGTFTQYGLLAAEIPKPKLVDLLGSSALDKSEEDDPRVFLNVSPPWSAFICGSQGSGKSHTLSCMLENCLMPSKIGQLPKPLSGMVFHYDKFTSYGSNQLCEAAYLCSTGIPVKVLVSPTNFWLMQTKYNNLPGLKGGSKPTVHPLRFRDTQLDVSRMMSLMAVSDNNGPTPLYIEVIMRILRDMAIHNKGKIGFKYDVFRSRLESEGFSTAQNGPLKLRLELLESFMDRSPESYKDEARRHEKAWSFEPGTLTIVDLSCPFVDENAACALFSMCLELFLESRGNVGRVVALDEAHKFMNSSLAAMNFTDTLLDIIRQQRHLATRVIIATQEPTISPKLLDLASMTIVHRFTSPEWLRSLRTHLAGASGSEYNMEAGEEDSTSVGHSYKRDVARLFSEIVQLNAGEALLFSPSSMLEWVQGSTVTDEVATDKAKQGAGEGHADVLGLESQVLMDSFGVEHAEDKALIASALDPKETKAETPEQSVESDQQQPPQQPQGKPTKLGMRYVKIKVRERLTADGGKSIMAE